MAATPFPEEEISSWGPDIFEVSRATNGNAVVAVGMELFKLHGILRRFGIADACMRAYLQEINDLYLCSNPYHNSIHGADVAQNVNFFLSDQCLSQHLSKLEIFGLILAALVHDCGHPGYTNNFLVTTRHELAIRYNDHSVLENFHIATAVQVALLSEERNIFQNLEEEEYRELRAILIELVLATDFSRHKELVESCQGTVANAEPSSAEYRRALMVLALKCADVSHTAKNMQMHVEWTARVTLEFFFQGNREREQGLPFSFGMDAASTNVRGSQVGFVEGMLLPLFEYWAGLFPKFQVCVDHLRDNVSQWRTGKYDGVTDLLRDLSKREKAETYLLHCL
eukprot:CAMPEP_0114625254 /NCGR_PEP_ID=MMETSP0168-20121206/11177_1 /TAXON_ID=95228 ORGANISM="Vannella sp., Strain DIVA3 517/6/12" /NCGR_SAMPLE_ID=MMETSP0168 /ASSEMBLY_ACC=CAM_ASM_000044 /LENGTH=339 /DNA_ID=CAMNT_0001836533 /DNA_START=48 /DNA_END=1064 /DNA_ORIENTATION=-